MSSDSKSAQEREWQNLHDRIAATLQRFGQADPVRKGDYWLLDENWGWYRHQLEIQNLDLLQPPIIKSLQALLTDYPGWDITVRIDVPGKEKSWPGMGLIIYHDEIVDQLQRQYLPREFQDIEYEGSRPGTERD
jgi:hypothetical protein